MAKKEKEDLDITVSFNGKESKTSLKALKAIANERGPADDQEQKPLEFISATIKDDFCSYSYEVKTGVGEGFIHAVKGIYYVMDDMHDAFKTLNAHLACIDDVFKHSGIEVDNIDELHDNPLTDLFHVSGFKMKGSAENLSIILIGNKYVSSTGGRIELITPKIDLVNGAYTWYNELREAAEKAQLEVELYHGGKYSVPEKEEKEKVPKNQTSILDADQTEEDDHSDFADNKVD